MIKLSNDQQIAVDKFLDFLLDDEQEEMAISGAAGTGKSFLTKHLIEVARKNIEFIKYLTNSKNELSVHITSTTNKASKVLADITGEQTRTIHSLLGLRVSQNVQTGKVSLKKSEDSGVIQNALILVDEGSMVNQELLDVIRESTLNCKVLYIGDAYQLAPVFENRCPVFEQVKNQVMLTTPQRQALDSPIITLGNEFRKALDNEQFPKIQEHLCNEIKLLSGSEFKQLVEERFIVKHPINDVRVVAWTNNMVHRYNKHIRSLIIADENYQIGELLLTNEPILDTSGRQAFKTDDITHITKIDFGTEYEVEGWWIQLNDQVTVFQAKNQNEVKTMLNHLAKHKNWKRFFGLKEFFADLRPIHSNTITKSQGSTYNTVFIDLNDVAGNNKWYEIARLMYVAITRASHQVYFYGELPRRLYW